jgi:ABC-type transport system involved in multi-copper enzyme maturation permease subunit
MSSKSIMEKHPEREPSPGGWQPPRERAPSVLREDEPRVARTAGLGGLMLLVIGALALILTGTGRSVLLGRVIPIGPGWGSLLAVIGLGLMLFHAAADKDLQVRRMYGAFGFLLLVVGGLLAALPGPGQPMGYLFLRYGIPSLALALLFLLAFAHNETDEPWHRMTTSVLGGVGALLALVGFIGGNVSDLFLLPYGVLLALVGLGYLWAFVGLRGTADDVGHRAGLAVGALGVLVFLVALGRSGLPPLFHAWGWLSEAPTPHLVPAGLLLMGLGALYAVLSAGLSTDNRVLVMARRELAAFFYSPVAYLVLFGFTLVSWLQYASFLEIIFDASSSSGMGGTPLVEPIVQYYIIHWWPIISMIFVVPALTMSLVSEERRSGSLEVLLTAPLDEVSVVLSKFLAVLVFFLVVCLPWGLFLVALRVQGEEPFDYRPLLSFFIALIATGSSFLSMGLFFSSLTRTQFVSGVMTFVVMFGWTLLYFLKRQVPAEYGGVRTIMEYLSYIDFWIEAVRGTLSPRYVILYLSATIFWLYLTVKVLEARKWM